MSELFKLLGEYIIPIFGLLTLATLFIQGLRKLAQEYRSFRKELAPPSSTALLPPASTQTDSKRELDSHDQ
jgi:hypothetical protein